MCVCVCMFIIIVIVTDLIQFITPLKCDLVIAPNTILVVDVGKILIKNLGVVYLFVCLFVDIDITTNTTTTIDIN